jgi:hypothetical protein
MGGYITSVSGQRLDKHVPTATVTYVTGETGCSRGPRRGVKKEENWSKPVQLNAAREAEKRWRYI